MHPLGAVLGLPLGFEIGPELLVFLGVFVGEDEVTGTQAVSEGVEAHGGLGLGSVGTGRVLCASTPNTAALASGVLGPVECCAFCRLASCCLSEITMLIFLCWVWGLSAHTRFKDRTRVSGRRRTGWGGRLVSGLVGGGCSGRIYYRSL